MNFKNLIQVEKRVPQQDIENCVLSIPWTYLMFSIMESTRSSLNEGISVLWKALLFCFLL